MAPSESILPTSTVDTGAQTEGPGSSGFPGGSAFVQYVPTVNHVYSRAYVALEETPSWGQEPPRRSSSRWMVTPVADCLSPDSLAFSPSSDSPPKQTAAKNLALGCGMVVLGLLMMFSPYISTRVAVLLIGIFLVVSGVSSLLLSVLSLRSEGVLTWQLLTSTCHVILGSWMLGNRHTGATLLLVIIAVWIVAKGFMREVVLASSVVAVALVLLGQRWWGLPGFLLGFDTLVVGACVVLHGVHSFRGSGQDSDPLLSLQQPPAYSG